MPKRSRVALSWILVPAATALGLGGALPAAAGGGAGPDVTVIRLTDTTNHGALGGVRAYSLGTTSCNVGTQPLNWCNETGGCGGGTGAEDHPVIAPNLYRLKDGRFEQIGMSWLKHGFLSTNSSDPECGSCVVPPLDGDQLGVGCTDTYGSSLNGRRPLGMRSEVNGTTGAFPYPFTVVEATSLLDQRLQVAEADLDPALNPGALYWAEALYLASDDAAAGNGLNNASYQEVAVGPAPNFDLALTGSTVREKAALFAWQAADPGAEIVDVDVPGSSPVERFHVGRRVTSTAFETWHYEYAIENLNSHRGVRIFAVWFPTSTTFANVGFRAVDHHSGEPYDTGDWRASTALENIVVWFADPFGTHPDANALRWGTTFSFWFDASLPPEAGDVQHLLVFFRPGMPNLVSFDFPP